MAGCCEGVICSKGESRDSNMDSTHESVGFWKQASPWKSTSSFLNALQIQAELMEYGWEETKYFTGSSFLTCGSSVVIILRERPRFFFFLCFLQCLQGKNIEFNHCRDNLAAGFLWQDTKRLIHSLPTRAGNLPKYNASGICWAWSLLKNIPLHLTV